MSREQYEDDCEGCEPAIFDAQTMQPMPRDSPGMVEVLKMWKTTTKAERQAWHNVTCKNSRAAEDMELCQGILERIQAIMEVGQAN